MKKFFKEFKAFISRGNVMDMAVGIIIGGAFTAIITALVNNILTPLLAMIPGSNDTGALQIVLRAVYDDAGALDVTKSVIRDFGAVISAIITFLLTAFVLFLVVKTINTIRDGGRKLQKNGKIFKQPEYKALRKQLKAEGKGSYEIDEIILAKEAEKQAAAKADEEAKAKAEAEAVLANAPETLLREIRDLLAANMSKSDK